MSRKPTIWMIAGANGVGKTTYAFRHIRAVSGSVHFINLDEIARGLSPLDPSAAAERAAKVALREIDWHLARPGASPSGGIDIRKDFSIETTLAGMTHLRLIARAQSNGWQVGLLYFALDRVETCLARIARRVSEGGHDVPEADVRRRFTRSLRNLPTYIGAVDFWRVFDNRLAPPKVVAEGRQACRSMMLELSGLPVELHATLASLPACEEGATPSSRRS